MRASRQSAGTHPSSSERWYIFVNIGDNSSAAALRIKVGIPSGGFKWPEIFEQLFKTVWVDGDVVHRREGAWAFVMDSLLWCRLTGIAG